MKKIIKVFYVVTKSGGVYEVKYDPQKNTTSAEKIFTLDTKKSKVGDGYQLYPDAHFVAITTFTGLAKYEPDKGKRVKFSEEDWNGHYTHTSLIVGLYLEKEAAVECCKNKYDMFNDAKYEYPWTRFEETIDVLKKIGKDHPVFVIKDQLYPKEEDVPF